MDPFHDYYDIPWYAILGLCALIAIGLHVYQVGFIVKLIRLGKEDDRFDSWNQRIKEFLNDWFGQRKVVEDKLVKNIGARPGDALVLTKPLGTGIISTAIKRGLASDQIVQNTVKCMATLNDSASKQMHEFDVHAATDVTGFGLLGHLLEMCKASNVSAEVQFKELSFLDGVLNFANDNVIPSGTQRNLEYALKFISFSDHLNETRKLMTADAQTSGGLLVALPQSQAEEYAHQCYESTGLPAKQIGVFSQKSKYNIFIK